MPVSMYPAQRYLRMSSFKEVSINSFGLSSRAKTYLSRSTCTCRKVQHEPKLSRLLLRSFRRFLHRRYSGSDNVYPKPITDLERKEARPSSFGSTGHYSPIRPVMHLRAHGIPRRTHVVRARRAHPNTPFRESNRDQGNPAIIP
jgi:hypothetical protein